MPKVTGPLLSGDARGQFGKSIIFKRGGVAVNYFKPRNPNSAAQQAQRQWFLENCMSGLTQEQADLLYAAIAHLHDDRYSQLAHLHDDRYSQLAHLHDDYAGKEYEFARVGAFGRGFGDVNALNLATITNTSRQIRYVPVSFGVDVTIATVGVNVTTFGSGVTGGIAIYSNGNSGGNDYPVTKLAESGSLDLSSNGLKTSSLAYTFLKGVAYWVAFMNFHVSTSVVISGFSGGGVKPMAWVNASLAATHVIETAGSGSFPGTAGSVANNTGASLIPAVFY